MKYVLFLLVVAFGHIIQAVTSFAGTAVSMPFAMALVGYDIAKPIFNILGLLTSIIVFVKNTDKVRKDVFKDVILLMGIGGVIGFIVKKYLVNFKILKIVFGIYVIVVGLLGLIKKNEIKIKDSLHKCLLPIAGFIHAIFVSGGPILVTYLVKKIDDHMSLRATLAGIWTIMNSIVLIGDFYTGLWTFEVFKNFLITVPVFLLSVFIGNYLSTKLSRELFKKLTYILLILAGITLLI